MRIALLTTETPHHLYYAWKLNEAFAIAFIGIERAVATPPFPTQHKFEERRDWYETKELLKGGPRRFDAITESFETESVNSQTMRDRLLSVRPDVILVFGTGKVSDGICQQASICLNLHGGDPEHYRGLDTHLWAIYHREFDQLVTTLHEVAPQFDAGDIVCKQLLDLDRVEDIAQLRGLNTEACLSLTRAALRQLDSTQDIVRMPQRKVGRYYSYMPSALKSICEKNFIHHKTQRRQQSCCA